MGFVTVVSAADRWRRELAAWTIPPGILATAPEPPYRLDPDAFAAGARPVAAPSTARAREVLPDDGTVLDVGCGAGAASFAIGARVGKLVGVDTSPEMLSAFAAEAARRELAVTTVHGRWPDCAAWVNPADVVVCHHVLYNVADLAPFAGALVQHARRRVVVEISDRHPWAGLGPLWEHFHAAPRPDGPTWEDALAVLQEAGYRFRAQRSFGPAPRTDTALRLRTLRRRLCLGPERDPEIAALLERLGPPPARADVTLWLDV